MKKKTISMILGMMLALSVLAAVDQQEPQHHPAAMRRKLQQTRKPQCLMTA